MKRMDEVLSYWASRTEEFPESLRMREETGCCFNTDNPYATDSLVEGHGPLPE